MLNAGVPVTKASVDSAFGGLATRFASIMADAERANVWLAGASDADLTALGYVTADIDGLRAAAYAYGVLAQVYIGATEVTPPTDFRVNITPLAGPG